MGGLWGHVWGRIGVTLVIAALSYLISPYLLKAWEISQSHGLRTWGDSRVYPPYWMLPAIGLVIGFRALEVTASRIWQIKPFGSYVIFALIFPVAYAFMRPISSFSMSLVFNYVGFANDIVAVLVALGIGLMLALVYSGYSEKKRPTHTPDVF